MFVPVCSGSDKTTTTVGTGQQEYHPVYQSPGNLTNVARRARGNGVIPVAFLPIPKSKSCIKSTSEIILTLNLQQVNDNKRRPHSNDFPDNCTMLV